MILEPTALPEPVKLESERINFYPIQKEHLADVATYLSDEKVRRAMKMETLDTLEKQLHWFNRFEKARLEGRVYQWAGYLKSDDSYACLLTIKDIDWVNKAGELGYSVSTALWGQGIATEAAKLGIGYAFDNLNLHRVIAQILPENTASRNVVEKLGFSQEARFHDSLWYEGKYFDLLQYFLINPGHLNA